MNSQHQLFLNAIRSRSIPLRILYDLLQASLVKIRKVSFVSTDLHVIDRQLKTWMHGKTSYISTPLHQQQLNVAISFLLAVELNSVENDFLAVVLRRLLLSQYHYHTSHQFEPCNAPPLPSQRLHTESAIW